MADPQFCLLAIDHWSTCMTKAEWATWAQVFGATAAIAAGALGINWQVRNQHRLQLQREVEKELSAILEVQEFLSQADHYLGSLAGAALTQETYIAYLKAADRSADFKACADVFEETRLRDIPGPMLKLSFKHCAVLFAAMTARAITARNHWLRTQQADWQVDRDFYAAARNEFHKSTTPVRERRSALDAHIAKL